MMMPGSQLFEDITQLPEYYPTRAETQILRARADEFAQLIGPGPGRGRSSARVPRSRPRCCCLPLRRAPTSRSIFAGDFLRAAAADLSAKFPGLPGPSGRGPISCAGSKLPHEVEGLPKSSAFSPDRRSGNMVARTATDLLRSMRETLGVGALLLIGMDLIKDENVLVAAYDDAAGITARFNLNLLHRINRELDGDIPVNAFAHEARWNDTYARIEMHLVAQRDMTFSVSGQRFTMSGGDTIHTENSHKFTRRTANVLLAAGGWEPRARWTDSEERFSLLLAEARPPRSAP